MPTTAVKPARKLKTDPLAALDAMTDDAIAEAGRRWRRWAVEAADGKATPDPAELLAAAGTLAIDDAPAALRADAEAILEARRLADRVEVCEAATAAALEEFGGDRQRLRDTMMRAREELARLEQLAAQVDAGFQVGWARGAVHQHKRRFPRLWPANGDGGLR